ncbi:hypothetical protein MATL_G00070200 [Megalops atlanticus]|uniref:HTH CENPB-type domain-containing protein n=1 Tax=Megalops atlanticus TaxID=7932 RepID=A0A9D3Q5D7_MEGAT|nr:hypothetical protein MATL_G00070200 [Megalops atlanticus]
MSVRKRTDLTNKQKVEIIRICEVKPKLSFAVIAKQFNISQSTVRKLYKNRNVILQQSPSNRKRHRVSNAVDVDKALLKWFHFAVSSNQRVSGDILKAKAVKFAADLNVTGFNASNGWLDRWKKRNDIAFKRAFREKEDTDTPHSRKWIETDIPALLRRYKPEDVYNADETGLYYRALPPGYNTFRKTAQCEGEGVKDRVTLLVCCSMSGEKMPILIIGKSKQSQFLREVQDLPVQYFYDRNAWMTSDLFAHWLEQWDASLASQQRFVALVVDNCPAHPPVKLNNIELVFLPPNVSSQVQPCHQGIIRTLKAHYRRQMVSQIIAAVDAGDGVMSATEHAEKIDLLSVILMVKEAWDSVRKETILDSFCAAGFTISDSAPALVKEEPVEQNMILEGITEQDLDDLMKVEADDSWTAPLTDEDFYQAKENQKAQHSDSEEDDSAHATVISPAKAQESLTILRTFLAQNGLENWSLFSQVEKQVEELCAQPRVLSVSAGPENPTKAWKQRLYHLAFRNLPFRSSGSSCSCWTPGGAVFGGCPSSW